MPYLRRLVLLLTLSTSILLVTIHLLHFSRSHHQEPLHPVITKEQAEKDFNYLKQYEHPTNPADMGVPNPDYAAKIAFGKDPPRPPTKDDINIPEQKDSKSNPKPDTSKDVKVLDKESKPKPVPKPDTSKDVKVPEKESTSKPVPKPLPKPMPLPSKPEPKLDKSRIAPANATAWHKDKNMWRVVDALHG